MTKAVQEDRSITDADAEKIAECFRKQIVEDFYKDLGKSFWRIIWKSLVLGALAYISYEKLKGNG